jgi:hypothetical protein
MIKVLEHNTGYVSNAMMEGIGFRGLAITPLALGDNEYWVFRVKLTEEQSIIAFPKFFTLGIGFAKERDWNTNLPYTSETEKIYNHIKHNKGNAKIKKADCIEAIKLLQQACSKFIEKGGTV